MQARMKDHPLSPEQIAHLLDTELVGRLATNGADGCPYVTPVHFTVMDGTVYIHGLAAGEKLANIKRDPLVGFEVDKMLSLIHHPDLPCDTNTAYQSVIIRGRASVVQDTATVTRVLDAIVAKYTPRHAGKGYPPNMLKMTAVIAVDVTSCTGKFYPA